MRGPDRGAMRGGRTRVRVPQVSQQSTGRETSLGIVRLVAGKGERHTRHLRLSAWNMTGSEWHFPCHNWRMAERPGNDLAAVLSEELRACRKRGIERLDVSTHNQQPLVAPRLEELAAN